MTGQVTSQRKLFITIKADKPTTRNRPARHAARRIGWYLEIIAASALFILVALNLAYMHILATTVGGALLLLLFWLYLKARYGITVPVIFLLFVLGAIEVDSLGNYFQLYNHMSGPVQYDELTHFTIPALMAPAMIWLLWAGIERFGYRLPLGLITFFAIAVNFTLSGFYEIVELWDERYFGGRRIWGPHDTPNDLQWGLAGITLGSVLTYLALKYYAKLEGGS